MNNPLTEKKYIVIFLQLGSPSSPSRKDVKKYLRAFLGHPRVVDLPRFLWKMILNLIILPFRAGKSARKYRSIWKEGQFPLTKISNQFLEILADLEALGVLMILELRVEDRDHGDK